MTAKAPVKPKWELEERHDHGTAVYWATKNGCGAVELGRTPHYLQLKSLVRRDREVAQAMVNEMNAAKS